MSNAMRRSLPVLDVLVLDGSVTATCLRNERPEKTMHQSLLKAIPVYRYRLHLLTYFYTIMASVHLFISFEISQLLGYFPSEFWDRIVSLSAHDRPAIKNAVVALAALHERFEANDSSMFSHNNDILQGGFALQQ